MLRARLAAALAPLRWSVLQQGGASWRSLAASADAGDTAAPSAAANGTSGREKMNYDVLIVGAGPAGLSAAIRLKQVRLKQGCVWPHVIGISIRLLGSLNQAKIASIVSGRLHIFPGCKSCGFAVVGHIAEPVNGCVSVY